MNKTTKTIGALSIAGVAFLAGSQVSTVDAEKFTKIDNGSFNYEKTVVVNETVSIEHLINLRYMAQLEVENAQARVDEFDRLIAEAKEVGVYPK